LLIAGGGVLGLWLARFALAAGQSVVLCDAGAIGGGASGGFLGALMPHMPERWNDKKQFQFNALSELPEFLSELEAETGLSVGYRRCGRILPLQQPHHRVLAQDREAAAKEAWTQSDGPSFAWQVREAAWQAHWPDAAMMPEGCAFETLSARLNPPALMAALKAGVVAAQRSVLVEGDGLAAVSRDGLATLASGRTIAAGRIVVAAGHDSFGLLASLLPPQLPPLSQPLGRAVKGQAALLRLAGCADRPLVFHDGVYIVPHADGTVAVGSTSEDSFDLPFATDGRLEPVLARAIALCPDLAEATIIERWAGLRPRAIGREPMIGFLPGRPDILALTGGFKITLGIGHRLAQAALGLLLGTGDIAIPDSFAVQAHCVRAGLAPDVI
jgi:glycine oxidase